MPGLVGVIDHRGNRNVTGILSQMIQAVRHQDWYQVDRFDDDIMASLGRVSLGIFNPQKQPAIDEQSQLVVFLDGELSNREDLQKELTLDKDDMLAGDATLALHAYHRWGKEFAGHLEGSFTALVWDGSSKQLVVANDRFGLRPLHYAENQGSLLIGSEGKAILADKAFTRKPNYNGLACLLRFGWVLGDNTLFEGIRLLPSGSMLIYEDGQLTVSRYWFPRAFLLDLKDRESDTRGYLDFVASRFNHGVEKRLKGERKVGLFLTGGLDSRTILSAIPAGHNVPCMTFFGVPSSAEQAIAGEAAALARQQHYTHDFTPEVLRNFAEKTVWVSEGMMPTTECHGLAPVDWAKDHAEVILSGWGGEMARAANAGGGRLLDRIPRYAFPTDGHEQMKARLYTRQAKSFDEPELKVLLTPETFRMVEGRAAECFETIMSVTKDFPSAWDRNDYFFLWEESRRKNIYGLVFLNTAMEHRTPFADYQFVDALTSIPYSLHGLAMYSVIHRHIIETNHHLLGELREFATGLPANTGIPRYAMRGLINNLLAKRVVRRLPIPRYRAKFYVDYNAWMREQLRDYVVEVLLDKRTLTRGYFDEASLRGMIDNHMSGRAELATKLGVLIGIELWNRQFLD